SDPILRVVLWTGSAVLVANALLLLLVLVLRLRLVACQRRQERVLCIWGPAMELSATQEAVLLPNSAVPRGEDAFTLLEAWIYQQETRRGDACQVLNDLARQLSLDELALQHLADRDL